MRFVIGFCLIAKRWVCTGWAEDGSVLRPPSDTPSAASASLEGLRDFNTNTFFLLKHYAQLEAMVGSLKRNDAQEKPFWIEVASTVPGVGQMINNNYPLGGTLLFAALTSTATISQLGIPPKANAKRGDIYYLHQGFNTLEEAIITYAMLHATNANFIANQNGSQAMRTGTASIVPGVGQAINGDWGSAAGFFANWALVAYVTGELESQMQNTEKQDLMVEKDRNGLEIALIPAGAAMHYTW
jgi:hypothetical protein